LPKGERPGLRQLAKNRHFSGGERAGVVTLSGDSLFLALPAAGAQSSWLKMGKAGLRSLGVGGLAGEKRGRRGFLPKGVAKVGGSEKKEGVSPEERVYRKGRGIYPTSSEEACYITNEAFWL